MSEVETAVKAVAVLRCETAEYNADQLRVSGIKDVYLAYVYDASTGHQCCEITPSYCLHPVGVEIVLRDDKIADLEKHGLRKTYEDSLWEQFYGDLNMMDEIYVHCRVIENMTADRKKDLGDFDTLDDAIEHYEANPPCWRI
jgi:hypothetical protein